ncbi:hypothetical protein ACERK3_11580 [Phycisphaerales bacterium AB-hyl4]|uniref:Heme biosynthesis protein HemY n=1 Tax=Natronomicrosphaera hydrolytica TaxID=3242702 RepID=A0ABV4U8S8_9BACT
MQQFFRSLMSLLVGLALCLFGLFQGVQLLPAAPVWQTVLMAAPHLAGVLVFGLCLIAVVVGLVMLIRSARTLWMSGVRTHRHHEPALPYGHEPEPWQ